MDFPQDNVDKFQVPGVGLTTFYMLYERSVENGRIAINEMRCIRSVTPITGICLPSAHWFPHYRALNL